MIKPDMVLMTSAFESFKNYGDDVTFSITASGSIPVGGLEFTHDIPFDREGTIGDIYFKRSDLDYWRNTNNLIRAADYAGATTANIIVRYSSSIITVAVFIANPGGAPITATTTQFDFTAKRYDGPIVN